jgi:hypothetical protein
VLWPLTWIYLGIGNLGVAVPEFQLSGTSDLTGQPVRFTVEYDCSHGDAMRIVRASRAPLVVIRSAPGITAQYFIYSWDERTAQVDMSAAPDNLLPSQPAREHSSGQLAGTRATG